MSLPFEVIKRIEKEPEQKDTFLIELFGPPSTSRTEERKRKLDNIKEFYRLYENDALTFGLVNYLVYKIVSKIIFTGNPEDVKVFEDWKERKHFKARLEDIVRDIIIAGGSWTEPIFSSIDLEKIKIINPETMDYIRENDSNIKLDEEGKFLGYVQEVNGKKRYWYKNRIEEDNRVIYEGMKNEDLRDRIKYWKLLSFGDSELGISLVKAMYRPAIIRSNLEDMVGESAFRGGGIVAYLTGEPSQEQKNKLKTDLTNITARNIFLLKDNIKLSTVPIPEMSERENLLYLLADFEAAGLNIPLEALLSGTKTYRQDFLNKMADMETRIESFQDRLVEQIEEYIIKPLLKLWKRKGPVSVQFVSVSPSVQTTRSRVIGALARRGMLKSDPELEIHLRKELKLPHKLVDASLEKWLKEGPPKQEEEKEVDVGQ